jgi:hypothetical protein
VWTKWLPAQGITVSIGLLLQISSEHAALLQLTSEQLFDPCANLRSGAALLSAIRCGRMSKVIQCENPMRNLVVNRRLA